MPGLGGRLAFSAAVGAPARHEFRLEVEVTAEPQATAVPLSGGGPTEPMLIDAGELGHAAHQDAAGGMSCALSLHARLSRLLRLHASWSIPRTALVIVSSCRQTVWPSLRRRSAGPTALCTALVPAAAGAVSTATPRHARRHRRTDAGARGEASATGGECGGLSGSAPRHCKDPCR